MAGDFDFMCINNDKSLAPIIMPGDVIAASNQKQTSPDPAHKKAESGYAHILTVLNGSPDDYDEETEASE